MPDEPSETRELAQKSAECRNRQLRSVAEEKPIKYVVEVKLIRDPESKEPVVLAAPKILLHEGTRGTVRIEETVMLQIEATVTPVK